jgi:hypothetical protein
LIKIMSPNNRRMTTIKVSFITVLLTASLVSLYVNIPIYSQNESNRVTQPGQNTGGDEVGQPETVTTTEGAEQKIRCSNGSLVDSGSECSSTEECPSEPSENVTLQCIQPSQQVNRNNNTNVTNASSLVDVDGTENEQEEVD